MRGVADSAAVLEQKIESSQEAAAGQISGRVLC